MNVMGYIYGKEDGSVSPRKGDKPNTRPSRQQVAGKARVGVPPTRLNNSHDDNPLPAGQQNGTNIPQHEQPSERQKQSGPSSLRGNGDPFDTDVEGIDESTIASNSVTYGEETHAFQPLYQGDIDEGPNPPGQDPRNLADLRGWANRMASEIPSDLEESSVGDEQETQQLEFHPSGNEESSDVEPAPEFSTNVNVGMTGDTASSRIEAALRETGRRPGIRQPYPMPSSLNRANLPAFGTHIAPAQGNHLNGAKADYSNQADNRQRSQSPGTIPIRGRFNKTHRFVESSSAHTRRDNGPSDPNLARSRPDPRLLPGREIPISPVPTPQRKIAAPEGHMQRNSTPKANDNDGFTKSKSFDLTDLSGLDESSDSNDKQDMPRKNPPESSKRPFDSWGVDYPSEVLLAKPFSDLRSEPFDFNPTPSQPTVFPTETTSLTLAEKLPLLKTLTVDQRRNFFSSLTIDQWEDCGDWLVEQFGTILQNVKNARHERRKVASVFEKEVERRYEEVEGKGNDLDKRLVEMKAGGLEVLRGRTP